MSITILERLKASSQRGEDTRLLVGTPASRPKIVGSRDNSTARTFSAVTAALAGCCFSAARQSQTTVLNHKNDAETTTLGSRATVGLRPLRWKRCRNFITKYLTFTRKVKGGRGCNMPESFLRSSPPSPVAAPRQARVTPSPSLKWDYGSISSIFLIVMTRLIVPSLLRKSVLVRSTTPLLIVIFPQARFPERDW
jgi:hypothetical protein